MRWVLPGVGSLGILGGCGRQDNSSTTPADPASAAAKPTFVELSGPWQKGAFDWPDGTFATPELTTGGVAVLDYDGDGRLDILQICHGHPGKFDEPTKCRLFHQTSEGAFVEVADAAGMTTPGYGKGVAVGDYDNDGAVDVYVTNFGHNVLYHNDGHGNFKDVTAAAGLAVDRPLWSSSASWFDYDRDGALDLVVDRFATFEAGRTCRDNAGLLEYCGPKTFKGIGCTLYHNNRDGTFTDVTATAGLNYPGRGWGVVCADFTGDGWVDIFVSNDAERQNLWVNQHDGTFVDEALQRGVAFNGVGISEAGMGIAVGDLMGSGEIDLFITHFRGEKNTLYRPTGKQGHYSDRSAEVGMAMVDIPFTGWGTGFFDFDNDGNLDVAVVNGRVSRGPLLPGANLSPFWNAYAEPNLLFRNDGKGALKEAAGLAGPFVSHVELTRGLAIGDLDNDGHVDLVTNGVGNVLRVYRNVAPIDGKHWLTVRAMTAKRDALGARIELTAGGRRSIRLALAGYSFSSSCDPRVHFGLDRAAAVDRIDILWPDGQQERFSAPAVDREIVLIQGTGQPLPAGAAATLNSVHP